MDFNELTRRPDPHRADCWRIYCADISAGWIALYPTTNGQAVWVWNVGFYPGSRPGEFRQGNADTFEQARAAFLPAWLQFARTRTPADFEAWREQQRYTRTKYAALDSGQPWPVR